MSYERLARRALSANVPETVRPPKISVEDEQSSSREFIHQLSPCPTPPPTEVTAKAKRRRFTAESKKRILAEAEACDRSGARSRQGRNGCPWCR
jgi:hypothetical protein